MDGQFTLKICTPRGTFLEEQVQEVTLPSADGKVGILPGHTSYTAVLGIGVMEFVSVSASDATQQIVVSNGFIQFEGGLLLVLADTVDTVESVNRDEYGTERASLQKVVETERVDSLEWTRAKSALDRIGAIDQLVSH